MAKQLIDICCIHVNFYSLNCIPGAAKLHELKSQRSACPRNPRNEFESLCRFTWTSKSKPRKDPQHTVCIYTIAGKLRPILRASRLKRKAEADEAEGELPRERAPKAKAKGKAKAKSRAAK